MIRVSATRIGNEKSSEITQLRIEVDQESIKSFRQLVDRALNCWDNAPKELKDFGDMLTHGDVTQDHEYKKMNTIQNPEYYTFEEQSKIKQYIATFGFDAWFNRLRAGNIKEVLDGTAKD